MHPSTPTVFKSAAARADLLVRVFAKLDKYVHIVRSIASRGMLRRALREAEFNLGFFFVTFVVGR